VGMLDIDRVRIVDASVVPVCGDTFSSVTHYTLQGLADGRRNAGTHNYSFWDQVIVTAPGNYRICYCGGRGTSCCAEDGDFASEVFSFVVAGAANDHYAICESYIFETGSGNVPCIIKGFHGIGIVDGDTLMIQDAPACGLGTGAIPGLPDHGVLTARTPDVPRDSKEHHLGGGTWYRFETQNSPYLSYRYDKVDVKTGEGFTARLCWCPKAGGCVHNRPDLFNIDAGLFTLIKFTQLSDNRCFTGKDCIVVFQLAPFNTPVSVSDMVMIKQGRNHAPNRLPTMGDTEVCVGKPVVGLGPDRDGISDRMRVGFDIRPEATIKETDLGIFGLQKVEALPGQYRVCWCQASIRPCRKASEFSVDIGKLNIESVKYVWPDCAAKDVPFISWRAWGTYDECCCNHQEAGAVGCFSDNTETFARCSLLPRR